MATDPGTQAVTQNRERGRFEIAVDAKRVGMARYAEADGRRVFFHTEVDEAFSGQGLAAVMVRQALDATREEGLRIVAVCPYVAAYVKRHHDWDDLLDRADHEALDAVRRMDP